MAGFSIFVLVHLLSFSLNTVNCDYIAMPSCQKKMCCSQLYIWVSVHHKSIIYMSNKPTRCNSGSIVFINNYKYALHVSDALCIRHLEHCKL